MPWKWRWIWIYVYWCHRAYAPEIVCVEKNGSLQRKERQREGFPFYPVNAVLSLFLKSAKHLKPSPEIRMGGSLPQDEFSLAKGFCGTASCAQLSVKG